MAWVIVGLGNPGEEYKETRHNAGRIAVEFFAKKNNFREFKDDKRAKAHTTSGLVDRAAVALVLPDTFMNKSGNAVARFVKTPRAAERLVVVHDDLDLPLGVMKISFDRGSGGHKGLESIMRMLKTEKFIRVRIGVSPTSGSGEIRKPHGEKVVRNFILMKFRPDEYSDLKAMIKKVADALERIVLDGKERAMNQFNTAV